MEIFKEVNNELARKSKKAEIKDKDLQKLTSYKEVISSARRSREQLEYEKTKVTTQRASYARRQSTGNLRILYGEDGTEYHIQDEEETYEEAPDEQDTDQEIFNTGKSEEEVEAAWDKKQAERAETKDKIENWEETYEQHDIANALFSMAPDYRPKPSSSYSKTPFNKTPKLPSKDQVCFNFVYDNCTDKSCGYSHDKQKVEDYLWKQYNRLKYSHFWNNSILNRPPPTKTIESKGTTPEAKKQFTQPTVKKVFLSRDGSRTPFKGQHTQGQNKILEEEPYELKIITVGNGPAAEQTPASSEKLGTYRTTPSGVERSDPSA
jgi:hypothetical protein